MNAEQQAAFGRMLRLENHSRYVRKHEEHERPVKEWKRLQAIVDGAAGGAS